MRVRRSDIPSGWGRLPGLRAWHAVFPAFFLFFVGAGLAQGQQEPALSNPSLEPTAGPSQPPVGGLNPHPSAAEGEKAPVKNKDTSAPEFTLPDVVITGENELTIGAKRLERKENEVTLGSRDLRRLERSLDDLPGLQKTLTALSTEEAGPSQDTALILRAGGGRPGTFGGWGLFGQDLKVLQYHFSGHYSAWDGEPAAVGADGEKRYGFGITSQILPIQPLRLRLSGGFQSRDAELPYQGSLRETHEGLSLDGRADIKIVNDVHLSVALSDEETWLNSWNAGILSNRAQEIEESGKLAWDNLDFLPADLLLEGGARQANGDFVAPLAGAYDWEWLAFQLRLKPVENLTVTGRVQGQTGGGLSLPAKVFPSGEVLFRLFEDTQLRAYWRTDRTVEDFFQTYMGTLHVSPDKGFPDPMEVTSEWGGEFSQKIAENLNLTLSGSSAQILNYHQWTDIGALVPQYIQDYSTLPSVQLDKAGAGLQWNFAKDWQVSALYQWTQGTDSSGLGQNFTALPTHSGTLSLYRGNETLETRLTAQGQSERAEFGSLPGTLPEFITVGCGAAFHFTREFTLWLEGDNLLGQDYQLQPGYWEPRVHVRGGLEVIF